MFWNMTRRTQHCSLPSQLLEMIPALRYNMTVPSSNMAYVKAKEMAGNAYLGQHKDAPHLWQLYTAPKAASSPNA